MINLGEEIETKRKYILGYSIAILLVGIVSVVMFFIDPIASYYSNPWFNFLLPNIFYIPYGIIGILAYQRHQMQHFKIINRSSIVLMILNLYQVVAYTLMMFIFGFHTTFFSEPFIFFCVFFGFQGIMIILYMMFNNYKYSSELCFDQTGQMNNNYQFQPVGQFR